MKLKYYCNGSKINLSGIFITTLIVVSVSCKKFVEIPPPKDMISQSAVFANDATAISALNGLYSQMTSSLRYFMNGAITLYPGLTSDEIYRTSPSSTIDPFVNNDIPSNSNVIRNDLWRYGYAFIYQANSILEGVTLSTGIDKNTKQQIIGEVKCIRALCYFYLANLFGDVPLILTTDYRINATMPRVPADEIYQQIVADLQDAKNRLTVAYPSTERIRPNRWTASALLARVFLHLKDWPEAEKEATEVIGSGLYSLEDNLDNVFLVNSKETIWQLFPVNSTYNTAEGATFIPYSSTVKPTYAITTFLLNAFEPDDLRKLSWLKSNTVNGDLYFYPYKYKIRRGSTKSEYNIVIRLAEMYLIRAEARAHQEDISGAQLDLNIIRSRAGLTHTTAIDQQGLLAAVENERRIELFAEWGHRWFDLKRTGMADEILGSEKNDWQPGDVLYPIPLSEIQSNPFLIQNAGY